MTHVRFRYFIDTQVGVVRIERLLIHNDDSNNVLSTAIAYRSVSRYGYCVPYRAVVYPGPREG